MSIPFLLGPVPTGASFMLASIQNGVPFILNGSSTKGGIIYYWESKLSIISNVSSLGIFTAQGSLNSLVISDTVNGGGIAFRSDGVTIGNAEQPANIQMSQPLYATWSPPDILLSMGVYTISNSSGATAGILTANLPISPTIPANNIIILPVFWYFNCTSSGQYSFINEPLESIINWFCNVSPGIGGCSNENITGSGWTNLADCTIGNGYTYCPINQTCGSSNCNGPCVSSFEDCNYSSGDYVCQFNSSGFLSNLKWWTTPIFIGGVIAGLVIIIIIIILIYIVARRGRTSS